MNQHTAISLYLYTRVVQHRRTCACGGLSSDVTAVVCTVQRSHLSMTISPLKNDSGPTVKRRFGHHHLNGVQFQRYGKVFLTHTVYALVSCLTFISASKLRLIPFHRENSPLAAPAISLLPSGAHCGGRR